jgi:hypothetical protein
MCDGEEAQIRVFQEEEIRALFTENRIDFGKTPASCSGILQSSDISMFFKSTKQVLKTVHTEQYNSAILERNLKTAFAAYRLLRESLPSAFTSAVESKVIDALQQIVYTIHRTLNPHVVINGYIDCGQDAPIGLDTNGQPTMAKYDVCIQKCTKQLTLDEVAVMREHFQHFVSVMREHGKITEAEMDAKGIPNYNNDDHDNKPKDQRALHKQRAVVMNAQETVAQFIDYVQRRDAERLARDARRAERAAGAEERAAAKEVRLAEKRRWNSLSAEEKKAESNAKRQATMARNRQLRIGEQLLVLAGPPALLPGLPQPP